jgi:sigma-B regulation protein RsbU (phosphoserine phosphatase)
MLYLFFFSGLALFSLRLVVFLETLRPLPQDVKAPFAFLALFGFGQGIHEWLELRSFFYPTAHAWPLNFIVIEVAVLILSLLFLLLFTLRLLTPNYFTIYSGAVFLLLLWFISVFLQFKQVNSHEEVHLLADAYARWLLYLPASVAAVYAFLAGRAVKTLCHPFLTNDRKALALLFSLNGFFNGFIAQKNNFIFLGLSEQWFSSIVGFSVEFFRAILIIAITVVFLHSLRIFEHLFSEEMRTKEILERESFLAGRIQTQIIKKAPLTFHSSFIYAKQLQAYRAGGDIYRYLHFNEAVGLFVGDVSGKGVSSALIAALAVVVLEVQAKITPDPRLICLRADEFLKTKMPSNYFLTLVECFYYPKEQKIHICSCGHSLPFQFRFQEQRWLEPQPSSSLPIGLGFPFQPYETELKLQRGDKLLFFTDGLTDVANLAGKRLETEGVLNWLQEHRQLQGSELVDELIAFAHSYADYKLKDDITALIFEVR